MTSLLHTLLFILKQNHFKTNVKNIVICQKEEIKQIKFKIEYIKRKGKVTGINKAKQCGK